MLTPELLQTLSVQVVSSYINDNVPLSNGVAAAATANNLNFDETTRLIEVTNQIAYLKLQEITSDRTFEFPLADKKEVMSIFSNAGNDMTKEASETKVLDPLSIVNDDNMEKKASEEGHFGSGVATPEEVIGIATNNIKAIRSEMTKLAQESDIIALQLLESVSVVSQDSKALEKVAFVCGDDYNAMEALLCSETGLEKSAEKVTSGSYFESELVDVKNMHSLYKEAKRNIKTRTKYDASLNKLAEVLESAFERVGMDKEAAAGRAASAIGTSAVSGTLKATKATAKGATGIVKKIIAARAPVIAGITGAVEHTPKKGVWKSLQG